MRELELSLRLRNNRLKRRRMELGLNCRQMAERIGISYPIYINLENLRRSPLCKQGGWTRTAMRIAEYHGVSPEDLWPPSVLDISAPEQKMEIDADQLKSLTTIARLADYHSLDPEQLLMEREGSEAVSAALALIDDDARKVLRQRIDEGRFRSDMIDEYGLSREGIRQREHRAIGQLRQPAVIRLIEQAHPRVAPQFEPDGRGPVAAACFDQKHGRLVPLVELASLVADVALVDEKQLLSLLRFLTSASPDVDDYNVLLQRERCSQYCLSKVFRLRQLQAQLQRIARSAPRRDRERELRRRLVRFSADWGSAFVLLPMPPMPSCP